MAIYGQSLTIQYIAWDTVNNVPKTSDASNHTLRWVKDGVAAAPTNAPSEVDAANAPGLYKLTLTATETQCWVGTLCGKSSTSGVVIMPVTLTFERLPTAAPGSGGGLPVIGSAPLTNLDAAISSRSSHSAADVWSVASRTITGGTVDTLTNKTGFELSAAGIDAIWDESQSGHTTAGTFGAYLNTQISSRAPADTALSNLIWTNDKASYLDAAISSRLAASSYVAPDNASISAIKTQTDKFQFDSNNYVYAVGVGGGGGIDWTDDEKKQIRYRLGIDGTTASPQSNTPHLGSTYSTLDDLAAHVSTRLAASAYTAPDNDGISAIKEKTDRLRFDANSNVYATGLGGGGGSVQVIVQPLPVYPIDFAPDGGVVEAFTFARIRKSWLVTKTNLEGHDLRFIVFSQANPLEALAECSGDEIAITLQGEDSLVALDAAEREIQPGLYGWVLRDQTADTVLLRGKFLMKPAPDAG